MRWAKTRAKVKYDLALSGILNLPFAELDATISDIDLNGDNSHGFGPLVDALAAHADVPRDPQHSPPHRFPRYRDSNRVSTTRPPAFLTRSGVVMD